MDILAGVEALKQILVKKIGSILPAPWAIRGGVHWRQRVTLLGVVVAGVELLQSPFFPEKRVVNVLRTKQQ